MAELQYNSLRNSANLTSYWRLEGNSTAEVGAYNGTDTAITYSAANGKFGQGAGFNGSTSRIVISKSAVPTGAKSFTAWIKPSSIASNAFLLTDGDGTNASVCFLLDSDGKMRLSWDSLVTTLSTSTGIITTGNWYHVAFTATGTSGVIYLNGVSVASGSIGTEAAQQPTFRFSGRYTSAGSGDAIQYTGAMDDLAIFNRVLTAAEVANLYAEESGSPIFFGNTAIA